MHDFFNICNVAVMLPLELTTGFLTKISEWLADLIGGATVLGIEKPDSPIKAAVKAPVALVEDVLDTWGAGDALASALLLALGLGLVFLALAFVTRNMKLVMAGRIERSMNAVLAKGGGASAMFIGMLMTIAVQSSSITTSVLIPMIAAGVLTIRNAFPVTLGANVGTTITALLASLASENPAGLVIALHHILFNAFGILIWYPLPAVRRIPLILAAGLARLAEIRKSLVVAYVIGTFIVVPVVGILVLQ